MVLKLDQSLFHVSMRGKLSACIVVYGYGLRVFRQNRTSHSQDGRGNQIGKKLIINNQSSNLVRSENRLS